MVSAVPEPTPTQRLAETLLQQPLEAWVGERRGAGMSWRKVATELRIATGGIVCVNRETLRAWFRRDDEVMEW